MQNLADEFIDKYQLQTDAATRYIDLVSEIGELGKTIVTSTNYGKKDFEITAQMLDEAGDCLFSLLVLCSELKIDANEALVKSLAKYESRFERKGSVSSG